MATGDGVIIVGAGPAGAALAFLLARHGVDVTLIERQHDFEREFRGEVLMPSGREVFHQMGLDGAFDALPVRELSRLAIYLRGRMVTEFALRDLFDEDITFRAVSQPAMLEMLVAEASKHASFSFRRGAAVKDLLEDHGRIVGVRMSSGGHDEELRAALVIGADGRASTVRRKARLDEPRQEQRFDIVWCKVPYSRAAIAAADGASIFVGRGHFSLAYPTYDDTLQLAWVINKGTIGELRRRGVEEWVNDMAEHVSPPLAAHLRASLGSITQPFLLDVVCFRLSRWTRPGLLLIGDAAHPMSPVGGQGINIALRDAVVAANHLVPALLGDGGGSGAVGGVSAQRIDEATAVIQAERMPEIEAIQRLQQEPPRVLFGPTWLSRVLITALPLAASSGLLRRVARGLFRRFAFGVTNVQLKPHGEHR